MKKISLLLAIVMLLSMCAVPAFAEESAIKESASGFYCIEADGDQAKLSAADKATFLQADGLYFKDLNKNGALDVYEDYRRPVAERVNDLLSQMTLQEKAGTLGFGGISAKHGTTVTDFSAVGGAQGGQTGVTFLSPECEQMDSTEMLVTVDNITYMPVNYQVKNMSVTTFVTALTGAPKDQLDVMNKVQKLSEESRLGIPSVFSGDRTYNTWGGMIDAAHYAFGVAGDEELLYNLYSEYAKESVALGYHQVFHGYGNEIGSWYGDDPNHIAKMAALETRAYEENGFNSHSKHFIARGGRNSYVAAKSPADLIDSWKIGWQAVVDAGTQWVMTNNNIGITPGLQAYMDKATFDILREELGYDGIVCLDWPLDASALLSKTGVTRDGVDVSTLSLGELYVLILNAGVDMISCSSAVPGTDIEAYKDDISWRYFPDVLIAEIEKGAYTEEKLDKHVFRVLRNKFDLGIFEDPYSDWEEALALIGSDAYAAANFAVPMNNEEINLYRRPEITAMEEELMVKSTILLKNDGILPLAKGVKLYVDSNNETIKAEDAQALAANATIVDTFEEADACVFHVTAFDDAYSYMVEDAQAAGKPFIAIIEATNSAGEPSAKQMLDASALLQQTYKNTPDHGSSVGAFYRYVKPSITAEMLFGEKEPAGSTLFEVGYTAEAKNISWGELQDDIGVDNKTRLYMAMLAKENPAIDMPNNLGDVLYTDSYGMRYSDPSDISLSLLTVPQTSIVTEEEMNGRVRTTISVVNANQKAGVPFEICFVAKNDGGDGYVTAQVQDNGQVIAEKFVGLDAGQFRVVTFALTLEAGEHVIAVGDMTETIAVE